LAIQSKLCLETGDWEQAFQISEGLISQGDATAEAHLQALVVLSTIQMRQSQGEILPILEAARAKARESRDLKHTLPLALVFLEYEWLSGTLHLKAEDMGAFASMLVDRAHPNGHEWQEFRFWVQKARHQSPSGPQPHLAYRMTDQASAQVAASFWQQCECPYMRALMLFEGNEKDKRSAIEIMDKLGAQAVADKFKREMRAAGIKRIPRGIRKTTSSNKAHLTQREMEVLHLLQEGMQNKEIAEKLFVSPKTVDHHVSAILLKLDVNTRAKAVQEALRRNILSIESLFIS
jgi:DNA-binding CsgD family transcriptional regulator